MLIHPLPALVAVLAFSCAFAPIGQADQISDSFDSIGKKIEELSKDPKTAPSAEVFGKQLATLKSYYQQQDYRRAREFLVSLVEFRSSLNPELLQAVEQALYPAASRDEAAGGRAGRNQSQRDCVPGGRHQEGMSRSQEFG